MEDKGSNANKGNNQEEKFQKESEQKEEKKEKKGFFNKNFFIGLGATALGIATVALGGKIAYDKYSKSKEEKKKVLGESALEYFDCEENDSIIQKLNNQKNMKPNIVDNSCDSNYVRANSITDELEEKNEIKEKEKEFICPINQKIMEEPVITPYGTTYEKEAIIEWIKKHKTDYKTNRLLSEDMLVTNYILKVAIKNYKESIAI